MDASARSCGRWSFTEPLTDFAVRYSEQVPSKRTLPLTLFKDAREQSPVISSLPFVAETSRLSVRRRVRTIFPFAACMRQLDAERESPVILPFVAEISSVVGRGYQARSRRSKSGASASVRWTAPGRRTPLSGDYCRKDVSRIREG